MRAEVADGHGEHQGCIQGERAAASILAVDVDRR